MLKEVTKQFIKTNYQGLLYNAFAVFASSSILLSSELMLPILIIYLVDTFFSEQATKEEKAIQLVIAYNITTQVNNSLKEWAHLCAQELGDKLSHLIYLDGLDKLNKSPLSTRSALKDADHSNDFMNTCITIDLVVTNFASLIVPLYISQRTLFDSNPGNNNIAYLNLALIVAKLFLASQTSSKIDYYQDESQKALSNLLSYNNDMLRGHKLILSENVFKKEMDNCIKHFNKRYLTATQQNRYLFLINTGIELLSVLPLCYVFYDLMTVKGIPEADYLLLLNGLNSANSASKNINILYLNSKILYNSMKKLLPIFTRELETDDLCKRNVDVIETVEFQNVFYQNPDGKSILEDVSFKVHLGELIAFTGQSGAGKSTMFHLLQKFIYPTSGTILINNVPINECSTSNLRKKITCISSDTYLFNRSLMDNIRYGLPETVTDEDITQMIHWIGLSEKIDKLPDGLHTMIQNNGQGELSGGEKQLIHLIRALLKDKKNLLFLDEAVCSIDESKLTNIINPHLISPTIKQNRITFMISHDSKNVQNVDRNFKVADKRVIEAKTQRFFKANEQKNQRSIQEQQSEYINGL